MALDVCPLKLEEILDFNSQTVAMFAQTKYAK